MKNKITSLVGAIFFFLGIGILIGGIFEYKSNQQFLQSSQKSTGIVTDLILGDSVYYPVLQFRTLANKTIDFKSSVGSNPPSYRVGDTVEIYYNPTDPYSAKISDFWSNWFGVIITGFLGTIFTFLGGIFLGSMIRSSMKKKWLLQYGKRISSEFQKVEINESFSANGIHPYIIVSQWQDPETRTIHIFKSENIMYNPEKYITNKSIDVLVDPMNCKKYYTDISFLPKSE